MNTENTFDKLEAQQEKKLLTASNQGTSTICHYSNFSLWMLIEIDCDVQVIPISLQPNISHQNSSSTVGHCKDLSLVLV